MYRLVTSSPPLPLLGNQPPPAHLFMGVRIEVKQKAVLSRVFILARPGAGRTFADVALRVHQQYVIGAEAEPAGASARSKT